MDDEALGVTDVRQMTVQLKGVDEANGRLESAPDPERKNGALSIRQIFLRLFVLGTIRQSGVAHETDA